MYVTKFEAYILGFSEDKLFRSKTNWTTSINIRIKCTDFCEQDRIRCGPVSDQTIMFWTRPNPDLERCTDGLGISMFFEQEHYFLC